MRRRTIPAQGVGFNRRRLRRGGVRGPGQQPEFGSRLATSPWMASRVRTSCCGRFSTREGCLPACAASSKTWSADWIRCSASSAMPFMPPGVGMTKSCTARALAGTITFTRRVRLRDMSQELALERSEPHALSARCVAAAAPPRSDAVAHRRSSLRPVGYAIQERSSCRVSMPKTPPSQSISRSSRAP